MFHRIKKTEQLAGRALQMYPNSNKGNVQYLAAKYTHLEKLVMEMMNTIENAVLEVSQRVSS